MAERETKKELNVDGFLKLVGEYGKFQKILTLIFSFMIWPYIFVMYMMYFVALQPGWRCAANSTVCHVLKRTVTNDDFRCKIPRTEWEYVQLKEYSIIVEYDLFCHNYLVHLSTSILFVGALFGSIFLGWYSDNFGRKKLLFVCFFFVVITNFVLIFMPSITSFIAFRFVTGFLIASVHPCYYVTLNESVGERYRPIAGNSIWFFYTLALCVLSLKAYLIPSWKTLIIACTLPYLFLMLCYKFVPESVRWLRLKGRFDEALKTFQRMAQWNRKEFDSTAKLSSVSDTTKRITSPLDVFRPKKMASNSVILVFSFYTISLIYYGMSLAADDLGSGSIHLNFVLVSLVEFPAAILSAYLTNRFGRKKPTAIPLFVAGFLTLVIGFIPKTTTVARTIRLIFGMLGKLLITLSYDCIEVLVIEIYPTNIRSEAFSIMAISGWVGAASAPWIAKGLSRWISNLPFYVMGILGIFAGCVCYFLPETKGVTLKESNTEVELNANGVEVQTLDTKI